MVLLKIIVNLYNIYLSLLCIKFVFYIYLLYSLYINLYLNFGVTINRYNRGKSYKENGQKNCDEVSTPSQFYIS